MTGLPVTARQQKEQQPCKDHRHAAAAQVDQWPQRRDGQPCRQIIPQPRKQQIVRRPAQRSGQPHHQNQRQAEVPDLRFVVGDQFQQASNAQRPG